MLSITLDTAKNIAIVVAVVFVVGAIAAAWIMKTIVQKVATAAILAILAFAVWTQRSSLQDCADKVTNAFEVADGNVAFVDTDCSFFGMDVTISDPRDDTDADGAG